MKSQRKIHKLQVAGIVGALNGVFNQNYYADKVLERLFKQNKKWGSRDRKFIAEGTYDIIRWWRKYNVALGENYSATTFSMERLWRICLVWLVAKGVEELPAWTQEIEFDRDKIALKLEGPMSLADWHSIPDWINALGEVELGDAWPQHLENLNHIAPVFLRVNTMKSNAEKLQRRLVEEQVECTVENPECLRLVERKNVFTCEAFQKGFFAVQDLGSQQIAPLLQPQEGERIVDACAGAGGKTLQMATIMNNKGKIIALDIYSSKLKELRKRASRHRLDIIETREIQGSKTIKRLHNSCDKLLLDVPCSGLGVLKRNPDTKWKLTRNKYEELLALQEQILRDYSKMVKLGGKMVYATCSLLPTENEKQIKKFLQHSAGDWQLLSELNIAPEAKGPDGFYAALLQRKLSHSDTI